MPKHILQPILATVLILIVDAVPAWAQGPIDDFQFRLNQETVKKGEEAILSVTLVRKVGGEPVSGAVIFARRLDMSPENMPTMTADLISLPSEKPGIYRFEASLPMQGNWLLSLAAKVQGVIGTVQSRLTLKVRD